MGSSLIRRCAADLGGTATLIELGSGSVVAFGVGVGYPKAMAAEAAGTFLLATTIFALAVGRHARSAGPD